MYVLLDVKEYGIDDEPTAGSQKLVKSGGVFDCVITNGSAFDISAHFASGSTLATYADLSAALTALNTLSASYKRGGMSIKYVQSSDNKYVQYRLMADEFTTDTTQWTIAYEGVLVDNPEFIEVKLDANGRILWGIKVDGTVYFGAGVPPQVVDYIQQKIEGLSLDEYEDIVAFLNGLEEGENTLQQLLNLKADKANPELSGKISLDKEIGENDEVVEASVQHVDNPEFVAVWLDKDERILFGVQTNGNFLFGAGVPQQIVDYVLTNKAELQSQINALSSGKVDKVEGKSLIDVEYAASQSVVENPEYMQVEVDSAEKILGGRKADGTKFENLPFELQGMNVKEAIDESKIRIDSSQQRENIENKLKVVVKNNKSFYVRYHVDDINDGILLFDYYNAYNYNHNCISQSYYYIGSKENSDDEIMASIVQRQNVMDCISPMFTANFGPMFSNHGYSTPKVVINNHGLTDADAGTEWIDQSGYHYTIGKVDGNNIYLLPVITSTGTPGYETRQWKWYSSPYPTQITRVGGTQETLSVASSSRFDYQVSELRNIRITIGGNETGEGTYYCNELALSYEQIGYNPINISQWWPTPVYNDVMLYFERTFTICGGKGSLSLTTNTVVNNQYPYPVAHYIDTVPMFPFKMGNYDVYVYIPKMVKHNGDIDFRKEFVSNDNSHASISFSRNVSDIADINDMPERAYAYLKDSGGNILYGCAGGKSLVRGMSVKAVRNNYIAMNKQVGIWYPGAGNKFYSNVINPDGDDTILPDNILSDSFINEFEGYMCWYKPVDSVHTFYHKTDNGYVIYIHTNKAFAKGVAVLPDFMNGMGVESIVEKTDGISLLADTIINGKVCFKADNTYNYIVFKINTTSIKREKLMKVIKSGGNISVRTKLSNSRDIVIRLNQRQENTTFRDFFIGSNALSDGELISDKYKVSDVTDMIGAVGVSTFWYLYAQHGWTIPRMTVISQTLDNTDVGSIWKDQNNRQFKIGNINGNYIYLLPVITEDLNTGIYSASWNGKMEYPTSLIHVSGATHTETVTGTSSRFDLTIQTVNNRKFIVDKNEITDDGIYWCDDFVISEHIIGHSAGKVTSWFPSPVYGGSLIDFDRNFVIKGSSITVNTLLNVQAPFIITDFRGIIPQMPLLTANYNSYSMIPKVKGEFNLLNADGTAFVSQRVDKPFNSNDGAIGENGNGIIVYRNSAQLFDVDNQPDRCITYLKDSEGNYLVGMAGGCSLFRGLSKAESRNLYTADGEVSCTYGGATPNKFYPLLLRSTHFDDGIVPDTFITEVSGYFSWFEPAYNEGQVYWYKDGNNYIVYAHCQTAHSKLSINLPPFMEGMVIDSVIEKTEGATILTQQVVNGKLYVSYDTTEVDANYIVIKLK